jgi:site-specific DNA-cytosine methylase
MVRALWHQADDESRRARGFDGEAGVKFLSVCSGIEAASCALEPIGCKPVGFAEIDKGACKLLARRFPHVRNFGDFTAIDPTDVRADWLIGGTPCQDFSIAGKRISLQGARGNLTFVRRLTPRECERLQGFRDDWTLVPVKKVSRKRLRSPKVNTDGERRYVEIDGEVWQLASDGPRYKQLGNSMAVPVIAWIGRRILADAARSS